MALGSGCHSDYFQGDIVITHFKKSFMRKKIVYAIIIMAALPVFNFSCKKESVQKEVVQKSLDNEQQKTASGSDNARHCTPDPYNLDVTLNGAGNSKGDIKFRQDPDPVKIVTLNTKVKHLQANHEYLLQRAVDQTIDGNCTGTAWLTLGLGLTPQSISTNGGGNGHEELWRDLSAIPSGTVFNINFRVIDATNMAVVLTSGCYQYTVR
jgi:hypothetical protein